MTQQESRLLELETGRAQDRKKITLLENSFKDQLTERNNLLLTLWTRLSALCGKDWAHNNSLINGRALPTVEAVSTMLPGFSKNLFAAIKTIETLTSTFKTHIRTIEKDLSKAYTSLEEDLEAKSKKLDRLEAVVRSGVATGGIDGKAEIAKLKDINRMLKAEVASLRTGKRDSRAGFETFAPEPSPSPSVPMGPGAQAKKVPFESGLPRMRPSTTTGVSGNSMATLGEEHRTISSNSTTTAASKSGSQRDQVPASASGSDMARGDEGGGASKNDQRWIYKLRELEKRLNAEREARKLDRDGARKRLLEGEKTNLELQAELDRGKMRAALGNGLGSSLGGKKNKEG